MRDVQHAAGLLLELQSSLLEAPWYYYKLVLQSFSFQRNTLHCLLSGMSILSQSIVLSKRVGFIDKPSLSFASLICVVREGINMPPRLRYVFYSFHHSHMYVEERCGEVLMKFRLSLIQESRIHLLQAKNVIGIRPTCMITSWQQLPVFQSLSSCAW